MTLLIVDDEIFAVQALIEDIHKEELGIDKMLTANCYAQAVNIFLQEPVDILLCDIEMPFGSGLDLTEWVKEHYPKTECIFLTCHDEFDFARQAIHLQCRDYILKPAEPAVVNGALKKVIDEIKSTQEENVYKEYGKIYLHSIAETPQGSEEAADSQDAVEKTQAYIALHLDEDLLVEDLAARVYISSAHLSRLFKKKYGMTVNDYITSERMKVAKHLLETTDLTVTMISAKTGYSNYSYFIKVFKKTYGVTPREFRQTQGEK